MPIGSYMQALHETLTTAEVAEMAGIHRDTLLRWLRSGVLPEPGRDRHGWRTFTREQALAVVAHSKGEAASTELIPTPTEIIQRLERLDWNFRGAKTNYLSHSIRPNLSHSSQMP
jgi:site-specific DNA-methyltransferase (cytosine-N4-specific)